jgi:hypothetical protein
MSVIVGRALEVKRPARRIGEYLATDQGSIAPASSAKPWSARDHLMAVDAGRRCFPNGSSSHDGTNQWIMKIRLMVEAG